jgi:hypothetical protein
MKQRPIGIALLENRLARLDAEDDARIKVRRKQTEQGQEARRRPRLAYIYSGFLGRWKKIVQEA